MYFACCEILLKCSQFCCQTKMAENWPNAEQAGRCTWTNFFVGLPVAFFSGVGVAVSLLDEQTNSLVGVAISASLLPPAVNAGMMWVAYGYFDKNRDAGYWDGVTNDDAINSITREDFGKGGMISLLLTFANIVLVIIASMIMFRLKEVSNAHNVNQNTRYGVR